MPAAAKELLSTAAQVHPAAADEFAFLSKREVLRLIPISAPTLWQWVRTGQFPTPRVIGSKTVWVAAEVHAWMRERPARLYKGMKEGA
jgi:predicted DNA-binding transcriptional regulator AlpA